MLWSCKQYRWALSMKYPPIIIWHLTLILTSVVNVSQPPDVAHLGLLASRLRKYSTFSSWAFSSQIFFAMVLWGRHWKHSSLLLSYWYPWVPASILYSVLAPSTSIVPMLSLQSAEPRGFSHRQAMRQSSFLPALALLEVFSNLAH